MRRGTAVASVLLAGALGQAACSGGAPSTRTTGVPPVVTTTLPRTVTGAVDLRRLVISTSPPGYDLLPSPPYGAVDLARLLAEFSDAPDDDAVVLDTTRFKRGYTRGWSRASPASFLGVFVFEFADEAGARSAQASFAAQNVARKGARPFTVEGIADATGASYTQQAEGKTAEQVHLVTFVRGPRLYQVSGQFSDLAAPVDATVAFAQAEAEIAG